MKKFIWLLLTLLAAATSQAQSNAPVRLAIVIESAEASAAADVLTAELSKNPQINLLERSEIEKVYHEQGLSAANRDYLKLGQVLGADGVLVLHFLKTADQRQLSMRLVAVRPGITLLQCGYLWPAGDLTQWAEVALSQFQSMFPKLLVMPRNAVPVSIVNLRSGVASADEEKTEQELTELLYARLTNEKDVFVLERRKLDSLEDENSLNNSENTFWNGSYLIDGTIDRETVQRDKVTIDVQLTPPDRKNILSVKTSGERTNLPALANDLVIKVLGALKKNVGNSDWQPQAEASRYFEEAQWMLKWGMFQEAKSASDASWALGRQDPQTALLRIKACELSAGLPGICVAVNETGRVVFGQQVNPNVTDMDQIARYAIAPTPDQFKDLVRADELFQDALHSIVPDAKMSDEWISLGINVLQRTSAWLRYYYFNMEARAGQQPQLEQARKLCLAIDGAMENRLALDETNANTWLNIRAENVAFWTDTPQQCLQLYRGLVQSGRWHLVRKRFYNAAYVQDSPDRAHYVESEQSTSEANFANPCLAGWTWSDRKNCPAMWNSFIEELCDSDRPSIRLEGRILRCSYSWSEDEFQRNLTALLDYTREQHDAIFAANQAGQLLADLHNLVDSRRDSLTENRQNWLKDEAWAPFEREFNSRISQIEQVRTNQIREAWFEEKKNYFNTHTNFDFLSFANDVFNEKYRPNEAKELLPVVANFEERVLHNQSPGEDENAARRQVQQKQTEYWMSTFKKKLSDVISPPPPKTNAAPPVQTARASAPMAPQSPATNAASMPATPGISLPPVGPLDITRFWKIPKRDLPQDQNAPDSPQVTSCCYRDGKLWAEVRYDELGSKGDADFFCIDLRTFTTDKIQFQGQDFSLSGVFYRGDSRPFEIYGGFLYLAAGDTISRYSFKTRSWEQFPVPAAGKVFPVRLGNRLFFASSTSILEYADDGSFHTLASSRRKPAASLLDEVENYGMPHLFTAFNGSLCASIGNDVYELSDKTNDWFKLTTMPWRDGSADHFSEDGFVTASGAWGMFGTLTSPEPLVRQPLPESVYMNGAPMPKDPPPLWHAKAPGNEAFIESSNLWFLAGAKNFHVRPSTKTESSGAPDISLVRFAPGDNDPFSIPVRFAMDEAVTASVADASLPNAMPWAPQWTLQWTPQGLVMIAHAAIPGFWFVPAQDLQTAVNRCSLRQHVKQEALNTLHLQWKKELLAVYDKDQNGTFEPDEREAMICDPHYLELELPLIDANTNGLLEASELDFFDANHNRILDPPEQKAIEVTLSLLAEKLAKNAGGNGQQIDPSELPLELFQPPDPRTSLGFIGTVKRDSHGRPTLTLDDLTRILRRHVVLGLPIDRTFRRNFQIARSPQQAQADSEARFKAQVEQRWNPAQSPANTNPLPATQP